MGIKQSKSELTEKDYIRYLYQECLRKGVHKNHDFYSQIIQFINSPQGQCGFKKFKTLLPERVGIYYTRPSITLKKAF